MFKGKRTLIISLFTVMIFSVFSLTSASSTITWVTSAIDSNIKIKLNGEDFIPIDTENNQELKPILYNDRSYLPVRALSEALGIKAEWDESTRTIILGGQVDSNTNDSNAKPLKISSVKAYLHYSNDGNFSENIIDNPEFVLYNVFIGEGSAKGPSDSTRVDVEIDGEHSGQDFSRKVQLVAKGEDGKIIFNRISDIFVSREGKCISSFWLYDTGTEKIKLFAKILGQKEPMEIEKSIDFFMGE